MTGSTELPGASVFVASVSQRKSTKPLMRALVAALLASSSAPAVQAATCGAAALGGGSGGPPSISATEASTTQVLEEIRRRSQVAQQQMQPTPVSDTTVVPATSGGGSAASGGTAKPPVQAAQGAPASKPKYTRVASAKPTDTYEYTAGPEGYQRITASWGQAYLDFEQHGNIAPGSIENRDRQTKTAGYMSGTDWTWVNAPSAQAVQFGVYSGYNASFIKFGDTQFTVGDGTQSPFAISRTNSQQDITGQFAGLYLAAVRGNATYDLTFKADLFELHDSSLLTQLTGGACGFPTPSSMESGKASLNNYTIAGDASYKHQLTDHSWLEPTFSFRYTITDYGSDATNFSGNLQPSFLPGGALTGRLGLNDGTVLRLQAGLRHGYEMPIGDGGIWTLVTGAYIYSDVLITGFKFNPGVDSAGNPAGTTVFPVDEGKVRGLGQIVSTWDYNNHWSYLLAGEIRGGEDLFGIGGRVGARYRW